MDPMFDDPADLTPQQRLQAVAAILARGVLRLAPGVGHGTPTAGLGLGTWGLGNGATGIRGRSSGLKPQASSLLFPPQASSQEFSQKPLELPRSARPDPQPVNGRRRGRRAQA
jgi:hypothetical protein